MSLMKKSVLAQAANIILGPTFAKFVNNKAVYGQGGLAELSLYYQVVMFALMFVYYLGNPFYWFKVLVIKIPCLRRIMINNLCNVVGEIDTI